MNPSDDLVSRLRSHGPKRNDARGLMNEAAAEIERLRGERDEARKWQRQHRNKRDVAKQAARSLHQGLEHWQARATDAEAKMDKLRHEATDLAYMILAYRNMLGEKGLEVARMWADKGVKRVHFDWGPDAANLTGEERAAFILELEKAPKREVLPGEIDNPPSS